jgi:hypothetical protein
VPALAIADEACDGADRYRALREQQLRGGGHAPRDEILAEAELAELRIGALELAR